MSSYQENTNNPNNPTEAVVTNSPHIVDENSEFAKYESIPYSEIPTGLVHGVIPYPHQLQSLYLAKKIETDPPTKKGFVEFYSRIAVIANTPGSGKTLIMLLLCKYKCDPPKMNLNGFSTRSSSYSFSPERAQLGVNIIVADNSILQNAWIPDMKKFFDNSIPWALLDSGSVVDKLTDQQIIDQLATVRILFVSRTVFHHLFRIFKLVVVRRIIFDELQSLSITKEDTLRNYIDNDFLTDPERGLYNELMPSNFIWICTATPQDIRTGKGESKKKTARYFTNYFLKNAFFFASDKYPELNEKYIINLPDEYIANFTNVPKPNIYNVMVQRTTALNLVEGIVGLDILNMIRNDQMTEAIASLQEGGTNIYDAALSSLSNSLQIQESELGTMRLKKTRAETISKQEDLIDETHQKIRELQVRQNRIANQLQENECSLCYDEFTYPAQTACCDRVYCLKCISEALSRKSKCPNCQGDLTTEGLRVFKDANVPKIEKAIIQRGIDSIFDDKKEALRFILGYTSKSLLYVRNYSENEGAFISVIAELVTSMGIKAVVAKKFDKTKMNNYISNFRNNPERCCWIMESETSSAGLNFDFVDSIITYDKYTSERQIMYRGLRSGRTTVMNFFRILYQEAEESG